jgi:hypothetical protein
MTPSGGDVAIRHRRCGLYKREGTTRNTKREGVTP